MLNLLSMRALLLVLDGIGDIRDNGKPTPLEAANKPNIDKLAEEGAIGFHIPYKKGVPVGSDIGHLALFGYDESDYNGRGPLEALGYGIELKHGSIAFRANLASYKDGEIIDRRAGRISTEEHKKIGELINSMEIDGVKLHYYPSAEHRAIAVLEGKNLSDAITDTDSHETGKPWVCKPTDNSDEAKFTAEVINKFTEKIYALLKDNEINKKRISEGKLPGNYVLFRGGGMYKKVSTPFYEKYHLKAAAVAGKPLYKGVAKHVGMKLIETGTRGDSEEELKIKAETSASLRDYDFVFMHVKETDTAGHDGNWEKKKNAIERVDKIIPILREAFDVIAITGDHSTPCPYKAHSGHPVPLLLWGKNVRKDNSTSFDEYSAMSGGLGEFRRDELMYSIINYLEKGKLVGN